MKILKFGGTSVGTADRIREVARISLDGQQNIVVLSAMAGTTDQLVHISEKLSKGLANKSSEHIKDLEANYEKTVCDLFPSNFFFKKALNFCQERFQFLEELSQQDYTEQIDKQIVAQGEILSTHLMQFYLESIGENSVLLSALDFMRVDRSGEPDMYYIKENLERLVFANSQVKLFITQGFICKGVNGQLDNLERGGSDYSASLIGAALRADEVQIWSDIDGFHNNDPRFVEGTKSIEELSFDEAAELAYFGAKIMHPSSILPAKMAGVPVFLKNTMSPQDKGTRISEKTIPASVKAVAGKDGISVVKIQSMRMLMAYGFLRKIFEIFERYETAIDVITTSEVGVSLTIDNVSCLGKMLPELRELGEVEVHANQSIVCVVGDFLAERRGVASHIFNALSNIPIRMISYGGSEKNVTLVVDSEDKQQALSDLHSFLFTENLCSVPYN